MRIQIFKPGKGEQWKAEMDEARKQGNEALVRMQWKQTADGYLSMQIYSNIYGFTIRDTMNDGRGKMCGNLKTAREVFDRAEALYNEDQTNREVTVVMGDLHLTSEDREYIEEMKRRGIPLVDMHSGQPLNEEVF